MLEFLLIFVFEKRNNDSIFPFGFNKLRRFEIDLHDWLS